MGRPKQLLPLGGKPVVVHSIEAFKQCPYVREIVVVTPLENRPVIEQFVSGIVFADPGIHVWRPFKTEWPVSASRQM